MGYLGAVIGAGFASGQEIVQFFVAYGSYGLKGTILATILFAVCGGLLLYTAHTRRVTNYQDILAYLLGEKAGRIIDFLLAIFLFLGISTMLSASGAVFYEHLYLPKILGVLLAYLLVVLFIITGKKGLMLSFNILVPVKLLLLTVIVGYAAFVVEGNQVEVYAAYICPANLKYWHVSSMLYVAYNFALAMVVLTEYQSITSRRNGIIGAVWGGIVLGFLVLLNYLALCKFLPVVLEYEVPMLYITGRISAEAKYVYTMVLWVGILTTAIANAYGFSQRLARFTGLSYSFCLLLCMTMALPISMQSFSSLVSKIYPIFGILGILILITLIYRAIKDITKELYYNIMQLINKIREE